MTSVIGKLACEGSQQRLHAEFLAYQKLSPLQGSIIPCCFGLFDIEKLGVLLLLEDCGHSLTTFEELSNTQKATLFNHVCAIHQCGILHDDLEPRNVVVSALGNVTVIDFELSDQSHSCKGMECGELVGLRSVLLDVE